VLSGEPLALLRDWLPGNEESDRPQIQLATADAELGTDVRTLLLTSWSEDGFRFHTDTRSRKCAQLRAEPRCSFALVWPGFRRQLVVAGRAEVGDAADLEEAYADRSPYLRRLAWLNLPEVAGLDRDARAARWAAALAEREDAQLVPPATWTGYLLRPSRLAFWLPDAEGPSHRVEYRARGGGWHASHLPG
jgi:pyridoxamine 5'-phosphate oxidase